MISRFLGAAFLTLLVAGCATTGREASSGACPYPYPTGRVLDREGFEAQLDLDPATEVGELVTFRERRRRRALLEWQEPGEACPRWADSSILFMSLETAAPRERLLDLLGAESRALDDWSLSERPGGRLRLEHRSRRKGVVATPASTREGLDLLQLIAPRLRSLGATPASSGIWIEPNYVWLALPPNPSARRPRGVCDPDWWINWIAAPKAWGKNKLGQGARVALLDSYVDCDHEEIKVAIDAPSRQSACKKNTSKSHGTAMAALIAAAHAPPTKKNKDRSKGVAPKARIIPLLILDHGSRSSVSYFTEAVDWIEKNGADIASASVKIGPDHQSRSLGDAVEALGKKDVLLIAAAPPGSGTIGSLGANGSYLWNFSSSHVLTVGGTDETYGWIGRHDERLVKLAAPAACVQLLYGIKGGTSVATALVAGAAALVAGEEATLEPSEIAERLRDSIREVSSFDTKCAWSGALCLEGLFRAPDEKKPVTWCSTQKPSAP